MTGLSALLQSRKAVLALLAMVCVTVLAGLGRVSGELALGVIAGLAGVYNAAQAYEDSHAKRSARAAAALAELAKKSGAAVALIASLSVIAGCGAGQSPPGCSAEDNAIRIAQIDREYLGKLLDECMAYGERANCPHAKRLESERDAKVKAYEQECTR